MSDTIDAQTIPFQWDYQQLLSELLTFPLILQKKNRKTGLVLEFSLYPDYETPRKSFSSLPSEIRELVISLRPIELFLDSALLRLQERFSGLDLVYNIYCDSNQDKTVSDNFDENYVIGCYENWVDNKYLKPVLIEGISFYHENRMFHFSLGLYPMNKYSERVQKELDKHLFMYISSASLFYNNIATELYNKGYLLFSGLFVLGATEKFIRQPLPKGFQSVIL